MTIAIDEKHPSRSVKVTKDGMTETRIYHAQNTDPEEIIHQLQLALTLKVGKVHPRFPTLYQQEYSVEPIPNDDRYCLLTIVYGPNQGDPQENQYGERWEWSLCAQQTHITSVAREQDQIHYGPRVGKAIGVDGQDINGVDVYRPAMNLKVSKHVLERNLAAERQIAQTHLNTTNSGWWKDYQAGEVLFIGANIRKVKDDDYLVEYNFIIARRLSPGNVELTNGQTVGPLVYDPWDYVWYRHETVMVDGEPQRQIRSIHIARVYERTNFSNFNLRGPI